MNTEKLIEKLVNNADFKSQFTFLCEDELKNEIGKDLYESICKEFYDHWSYELSEKLETIDIKALIAAAVNKFIESPETDEISES